MKMHEIICPRSFDEEHGPGRIHTAPGAELARHGGICKSCYTQLAKRHTKVRAGREETPVTFAELKHNYETAADGHLGFEDGGECVPIGNFDFDAVDADLAGIVGDAPQDERRKAGEVLARIFIYCFAHGHPHRHQFLTTSLMRFVGIVRAIRPDFFPGDTHASLARTLGRTKQAMSKAIHAAEQVLNIKFATTRSQDDRDTMAAAQLGHGNYHKRHRDRTENEAGSPHPGKESSNPKPSQGRDGTRSSPCARRV